MNTRRPSVLTPLLLLAGVGCTQRAGECPAVMGPLQDPDHDVEVVHEGAVMGGGASTAVVSDPVAYEARLEDLGLDDEGFRGQDDPLPEVDFDRFKVVSVFVGHTTTCGLEQVALDHGARSNGIYVVQARAAQGTTSCDMEQHAGILVAIPHEVEVQTCSALRRR